MRGYQQVERS